MSEAEKNAKKDWDLIKNLKAWAMCLLLLTQAWVQRRPLKW
jgi:hypothetical protein